MNKNGVKYLFVLLAIILSSVVSYFWNGKSLLGIDDANIYMVYMRNFANNYGFVFNIGGEKVEGFTSLLWTLIGSLFFKIFSRPEIALLLFNLVLISYALWQIVIFIDSKFDNQKSIISSFSLLFILLVLLVPGFVEFTILSLLETGLWSFLLVLLTLNILKYENDGKSKNTSFIILLVVLVLCRPESLLFALLFGFGRLLQLYIKYGFSTSFYKLATPILLIPLFVFIGLIYWRYQYFGFPFPNTYYAKVSSNVLDNIILGIKYTVKYFYLNPISVVVLVLLFRYLYDFFVKYKKCNFQVKFFIDNFQILFLITLVLLSFLIPFYTGGDHFNYSRFFQPTWPILVLTFLFLLQYFQFKVTLLRVSFLVVFSIIVSIPNMKRIVGKSELKHEWDIAINGRKNSTKLNAFFKELPQLPTQGVLLAGGSAFSYRGFTYDMLGLNNVEMAHAEKEKDNSLLKNHGSFNKTIFYRQKPDLFWLGGAFLEKGKEPVSLREFYRLITKNIMEDSKFKEEYLDCIISRNGSEFRLRIFAKKGFIDSLPNSTYQVSAVSIKG